MDVLTHGSFPRSGNHLLNTVLEFSYPLCNKKWIEHNAWLSLKSENFISVFREPVECVSSWIILTEDYRADRCNRLLNWYTRYHELMFENYKNIIMIEFNNLIKNPSIVNGLIYEKYGIKNTYDIEDDFYQTYMDVTYPENAPSRNTEIKKNLYEEIYSVEEYQKSLNIYNKISKRFS